MQARLSVSAILLCYNCDQFITEAIRSVVEQENDEHGDGSNLVARNYAERYLATEGILSQFEKALSAGIMT